ncbi:uncharacterized protein J3R85_003121 [Psidium guajava]|nr:uncharacterized protein J3R85_003121 [Psidium guajava]
MCRLLFPNLSPPSRILCYLLLATLRPPTSTLQVTPLSGLLHPCLLDPSPPSIPPPRAYYSYHSNQTTREGREGAKVEDKGKKFETIEMTTWEVSGSKHVLREGKKDKAGQKDETTEGDGEDSPTNKGTGKKKGKTSGLSITPPTGTETPRRVPTRQEGAGGVS